MPLSGAFLTFVFGVLVYFNALPVANELSLTYPSTSLAFILPTISLSRPVIATTAAVTLPSVTETHQSCSQLNMPLHQSRAVGGFYILILLAMAVEGKVREWIAEYTIEQKYKSLQAIADADLAAANERFHAAWADVMTKSTLLDEMYAVTAMLTVFTIYTLVFFFGILHSASESAPANAEKTPRNLRRNAWLLMLVVVGYLQPRVGGGSLYYELLALYVSEASFYTSGERLFTLLANVYFR